MRHVLLTLSVYMNATGSECYPSVRTLASASRLSQRSVCTHLERAEADGWIRRQGRRREGKGWRQMEYSAAIPFVLKEVQQQSKDGAERRSPAKADGAEPRSNIVLKEVHSTSTVNKNGGGAVTNPLVMTPAELRAAYER